MNHGDITRGDIERGHSRHGALHRAYAWSVNSAVESGRDGLAQELAEEFERITQANEASEVRCA
jgi:hypothetical protein